MFFDGTFRKNFIKINLANNKLYLRRRLVQKIEFLGEIISKKLTSGENVMIVPSIVGYYPIFERQAPMYDTYPVYPGTLDDQKNMLESIVNNNVKLCVINNIDLDNNENLRFQYTYPLIWKYLNSHFKVLDYQNIDPNYILFERIGLTSITEK